jgi:hypothetical protein
MKLEVKTEYRNGSQSKQAVHYLQYQGNRGTMPLKESVLGKILCICGEQCNK